MCSTTTATKTKTSKYKDSSGTFQYTGTSSKCTSATAKATSSVSDWKVDSKSASKSGNKATAKATINHYYNGTLVQITNPSVTLTCSATGIFS